MSWQKIRKILIPLVLIAGLGVAELVVVNHSSKQKDAAAVDASGLTTSTSQLIQKLVGIVNGHPSTVDPYLRLAHAYNQAARETADSSYYTKIDALLAQATIIDATNADIPLVQATVDFGRHHFREGLVAAKKARTLNPDAVLPLGLLADAEIELGQYDQAVADIQTMVDRKPDYASYVRVAFIRELNGDVDGAIDALDTAISAGSKFSENIAWAYNELGKLRLRSDLPKATDNFQSALHVLPNYAPALEGLGRVAFFQGDQAQAEKYFQQAFATLPIAQYAIDLGDLNTVRGKTDQAETFYALADSAFAKSASSGVNIDQEIAAFDANADRHLDDAMIRATAAVHDRPNIFSSDTLAWIQYRRGKIPEAQSAINEALRLGEYDATILYHASLIATATNNLAAAKKYLTRALQLNPNFSILFSTSAHDALQKM